MKSNFITFSFILFYFTLSAQLKVFPSSNAQLMVENIVGEGITNITNVNYYGADSASGLFDGVNSNLGIKSGVLLTTGAIGNAVGPNASENISKVTGRRGFDELNKITGYKTYDASILYFDFIPTSDNISMKIIFASEEYPEFVNRGFDDAIGVFVNSVSSSTKNIAVFADGNSININNINDDRNPQLIVKNKNGKTIQYDEFTTVISIHGKVVPNEKNSIKIVIADVSDALYDSGLFIESNSFISFKCDSITETSLNLDTIGVISNDKQPFELSQGFPKGGTYYGENVSYNYFNPIKANIGENIVYYKLDHDHCSSISSAKIYVKEQIIPDLVIYNYETKLIKFNNTKGEYSSIIIYDFNGNKVYQQYITNDYISIDGTLFESGWYHVVTVKNGVMYRKNILIY
jgi:hypothetical protein